MSALAAADASLPRITRRRAPPQTDELLGTRRGAELEDYTLARDLEGRLNLGPGEVRSLSLVTLTAAMCTRVPAVHAACVPAVALLLQCGTRSVAPSHVARMRCCQRVRVASRRSVG
jgi:hypothetical protein